MELHRQVPWDESFVPLREKPWLYVPEDADGRPPLHVWMDLDVEGFGPLVLWRERDYTSSDAPYESVRSRLRSEGRKLDLSVRIVPGVFERKSAICVRYYDEQQVDARSSVGKRRLPRKMNTRWITRRKDPMSASNE